MFKTVETQLATRDGLPAVMVSGRQRAASYLVGDLPPIADPQEAAALAFADSEDGPHLVIEVEHPSDLDWRCFVLVPRDLIKVSE